jgi:hypothetical protein
VERIELATLEGPVDAVVASPPGTKTKTSPRTAAHSRSTLPVRHCARESTNRWASPPTGSATTGYATSSTGTPSQIYGSHHAETIAATVLNGQLDLPVRNLTAQLRRSI